MTTPASRSSLAPQAAPPASCPQASARRRLHLSGRWQFDGARYPAPRGSRRTYDGQVYYQQQPQQPAYDNSYGNQYPSQPQRYYQQRGLFGYQN